MKNKNILYIICLSCSLAAVIISLAVFGFEIHSASVTAGTDAWTEFSWYIVIAAFAAADIIGTLPCLMGKMKENSVIYSVSRLFIFIFAMKMRENYPVLTVPMICCPIMYILSLLRSFKQFASRSCKDKRGGKGL